MSGPGMLEGPPSLTGAVGIEVRGYTSQEFAPRTRFVALFWTIV